MLLRQSLVRSEACQHACLGPAGPPSPAFRLCRLRTGQPDMCAPQRPHVRQQTAAHTIELAEAPVTEQQQEVADLKWVLQDATPLLQPADAAGTVAQEWSILPEGWRDHPTLLNGCDRESPPLRVAVLLSGGVDSSVALRLLQERAEGLRDGLLTLEEQPVWKAAGHQVTAFYLRIWFVEDIRNDWNECPWAEDLRFCEQVCGQAGVALHTVHLSQHYHDRVVAHSIAEIKAGRTPNPDIMCNSRVKFGAFLEHLEANHPGEFDRVASGHYAAVERDAAGTATLAMTPDPVKDQTYFLAHLTQAQLARCMFPLAPLTKGATRALAAAAALPTQARRDSQGICFLGKVPHAEYIEQYLDTWPGPLIEEETNTVLGYHNGFWFHTIGQRKGIHLHGGPWYVVRKDIVHNAVYISRAYHVPDRLRNGFRCGPFNWLGGNPQPAARLRRCKVRHGPDSYACSVRFESGSGARLNGADVDAQTGCSIADGSGGEEVGTAAALDAVDGAARMPAEGSAAGGDVGGSGGAAAAPAGRRRDGSIGSSTAAVASARSSGGGGSASSGGIPGGADAGVYAVAALDGQDQGIAPGQYAVFYDGEVCVASAVIQESLDLRHGLDSF